MRMSSPLVLTFLLNALWQVALIAGLAASGSWLLRNSVARYRHWLWASALCLAFFVPAFTASQTLFDTVAQSSTTIIFANENIPRKRVTHCGPYCSKACRSMPIRPLAAASSGLATTSRYACSTWSRTFGRKLSIVIRGKPGRSRARCEGPEQAPPIRMTAISPRT